MTTLATPIAAGPEARSTVLEVRAISKSFGGVQALDNVSFHLRAGEVLGLIGDNGAGKSTLIKCLSGVHRPDAGAILVDGVEVSVDSPLTAQGLGIETVHQGLALVETLDVATNLFLNRELVAPRLGWLGWLDKDRMYERSEEILATLGIRVESSRTETVNLSGGQRQAIAIGRAIGWGRHIVLMDEPAAALGVEQARHVLELIAKMREQGIAVILISHNMQQVVEICDRAIVMLHGRKSADVDIAGVREIDLVHYITGGGAPA